MSDWLTKLEEARLKQNKTFNLDIIKTSYQELDKALGVGGIPRGKIIEIAGHPSVGKTALVLDIVAQAQEKGLQVIYLDLDRKFDKDFAICRAIKCEELLVFRPEVNKPENIIEALKQFVSNNLVDVIVFDTISAYNEGIPVILSEVSKLIVNTNITIILASQIRANFQDPRDYNTPYMKVLNQYSNIRMMMKKVESIKHEDILIGKRVAVNIYKNSMSYPKSTEIEIYF